jgi:glycosyltransferase domain-containing protein
MPANFTIVIPTYNQRHELLKRLLSYYKNYDLPVLIADSSASAYPYEIDKVKICYLHCPSLGYYEKLIYVMDLVNTEFVVFCADDDFLVPKGIQAAVSFLKSNPEYSIARGSQICFLGDTSGIGNFVWISSEWESCSLEEDIPSKRLFKQFSSFKTTTFYAVHRTSLMRELLRAVVNNSDDYLFGEYIFALLAIIRGKYKIIDCFYSARTAHPTSNPHTFYNFIMNGTFDAKYERFRSILSKELADVEDINLSSADKLIDLALAEYLKNDNFTLPGLRKKATLKKIINKMGLLTSASVIKDMILGKKDYSFKKSSVISQPKNPFEDPSNSDYKEFLLIKNIVESHSH